MIDVIYVVGTTAFFALMLAYVSFCERIGHAGEAGAIAADTRA